MQRTNPIIVEAMLFSIPIIGCSNTETQFHLPIKDSHRVVATNVEPPIQDLTRTTNAFWPIIALGDNFYRLNSFKNLKKGWDGYCADVIPLDAIDRAFSLLLDLHFQPEIFPTGRGSIQIEKYLDDDTFVEVEVSSDKIGIYSEGIQGSIEEDSVSEERVCELLEAIHGRER